MDKNIQLDVQSALSYLEEALNSLEKACTQAEKCERLAEPTPYSTDLLERVSSTVQSAVRALEMARK